jgi:uncharacterized protein (TIGR01777 family)
MTAYHSNLELARSAADVFGWLERPGALVRLTPPWERTTIVEQTGTVHNGDRVVVKLRRPPVKLAMVHEGFEPGRRFVDRQERGPFRSWRHQHEVVAISTDRCELRDQIDFELPLHAVSRLVMARSIRKRLDRMFSYRRVVLANDLQWLATTPLRIAVTGASGLIGRQLCALLTTCGHTVLRMVRRPATGPSELAWDPQRGTIDAAALEGIDAVVHLAGENVGEGKWTPARKEQIVASRVKTTELLATTLANLRHKPAVLVSASAVGYYGAAAVEPCDESASHGDDFLAHVVQVWEAAARSVEAAGIRVVFPRIGVVLTPAGGALQKLVVPFSLGVGGPIGPGTQGFPWVAMDDVLYAIQRMIVDDRLTGPINVVGPEVVDNRTFARTLARVVRRPCVFRVPSWLVPIGFGELGEVVLLGGQRVVPARLRELGYSFAHPTLESLLRHELGRAG